MGFSKSIKLSFILLILCSAIIAISGIRGFIRLAPSIDLINKSNTQSLYYAEQMLSGISKKKDLVQFELALEQEKNNITESGEENAIKIIEDNYKKAFNGDIKAEETVIDAITLFSEINREAMHKEGRKAKKLSSVGIWVIAFPALFIWILGLLIFKTIEQKFIEPLAEIEDVIETYRKGNKMRRCPIVAPSKEFQQLYDGINYILDSK